MIKIKQKYDKAIEKFQSRIDKLHEENERDEADLVELEKTYSLSVVNDDGNAGELKARLREKEERVKERKESIRLLEENMNSIMVEAANKAAREYAKEKSAHQSKGEKLKAELQKAKEAYIKAVVEAWRGDQELLEQRNAVRYILKHADPSVIDELSLNVDRDARGGQLGGFVSWYDYLVWDHDVMAAIRKKGGY